MPTIKRIATEEDLLTLLAKKIYHVVNSHVENNEGIGLLISQPELQSLSAEFATSVVEKVLDEDSQLREKMLWAKNKFYQALRGRGGTPRQYAVALFNAVYEYVGQDIDLDDDELDQRVIEEMENIGVDYEEVDELINSIY